jgi:hypothetical protein
MLRPSLNEWLQTCHKVFYNSAGGMNVLCTAACHGDRRLLCGWVNSSLGRLPVPQFMCEESAGGFI